MVLICPESAENCHGRATVFIPAVTTFRSLRQNWGERESGGFQGVVLQRGIESPAVSHRNGNANSRCSHSLKRWQVGEQVLSGIKFHVPRIRRGIEVVGESYSALAEIGGKIAVKIPVYFAIQSVGDVSLLIGLGTEPGRSNSRSGRSPGAGQHELPAKTHS